jgi:tripartite-type tricarboxylate transporter receptor subunit TctC
MKRLLFCVLNVTILFCTASYGQQPEKNYPTRQVRVIVPYPPGGPVDVVGRLMSQKLSERLGQSFFVENVTGASGAVGTTQVAQAAPDGYTLLVMNNDFALTSVTNAHLSYDPINDFAPISMMASWPQVIAVNPSVPAKSMKELVDLIKSAPDKYSYAALGLGFGELSSERLFKLALKLDGLVRVPFNGAAPAVNSTLAGDTPIVILGLPAVAPYLESGKLRALAVTSPQRVPGFEQIPTLAESGIPGQESDLVIGMVAPAKTPPDIISSLQKQIAEALAQPDVRAALGKLSFQTVGSGPEEFESQIKNDIAVWSKVVKDANIPLN